ncbi:MAG: hypothetical protein LBL82_01160 [Oscillospiraceae bacterium]|jgi:hypothetical protein|nr:hypothetical protein [Oscillospiraceae bacterium]
MARKSNTTNNDNSVTNSYADNSVIDNSINVVVNPKKKEEPKVELKETNAAENISKSAEAVESLIGRISKNMSANFQEFASSVVGVIGVSSELFTIIQSGVGIIDELSQVLKVSEAVKNAQTAATAAGTTTATTDIAVTSAETVAEITDAGAKDKQTIATTLHAIAESTRLPIILATTAAILAGIAVVALLVVGIMALCGAFEKETEDEKNARIEKEKQIEVNGKLCDSVKETAAAYEESARGQEANAILGKGLADELSVLAEKQAALQEGQKLSVEEQDRMKYLVETLNELYPDLNLAIEENTGKLAGNTEEVLSQIDAFNELAEVQAMQERMTEIYKERIEVQAEIKDSLEALTGAEFTQAEIQGILTGQEEAMAAAKEKLVAAGFSQADVTKILNGDLEILNENMAGVGGVTEQAADSLTGLISANKDLNQSEQELSESYKDANKAIREETAKSFSEMGGEFEKFKDKSSDDAKKSADGIIKAYEKMGPKTKELARDTVLGLAKGMEDKIPALKDAANMDSDAIISAIKNHLGIESPSKVMKGFGKHVSEGLAEGMDGGKSGITTAASGLSGEVVKEIQKQLTDSNKIGKSLTQGLTQGINSGASAVINAAKSVMRKAVNAAKAEAGIKSPSAVWRDQIGKMIDQGTAEGLLSGTTVKAARQMMYNAKLAAEDIGVHALMPSIATNYITSGSDLSGGNLKANAKLDINNNTTIELDSRQIATSVNRANKLMKLQYGRA